MEQASLQAGRPALTLHRKFPVAPEKVWRAWTDPQALSRWFGPGGPGDPQTVSLAEMDVRAGGRYRLVFGGPEGTDHEAAGVYQEVVPNEKLVFTWCWPRTSPDRVSQVTILFRAEVGGTDMEFRHEQFLDQAACDGHRRGWTEAFEKLTAVLPTL